MNHRELDELREKIDGIDRSLLDLLARRMGVVLEIGELKKRFEMPPYDPDRERELLTALGAMGQGALSDVVIKRIFKEIISACRAAQVPTRVSYLGPEATYSHMAAISYFGHSCNYMPRGTISDVFREVEHGRAEFGVVPAENSNQGMVSSTMDEWVRSDLTISGEILLNVSHILMSTEDALTAVVRVFSHPQALAQCQAWLSRNLPQATLVETASTAAAARRASEESETAAIGGEMLASSHGLNVLARNIQDQPVNLTRFFVMGRLKPEPTGKDKTSILFTAAHQPGSLYKALEPLARADINLTRIESRPTQNKPWEYVFFVDFEGHHLDETIKPALEELATHVEIFKLLGSYPAADKTVSGES